MKFLFVHQNFPGQFRGIAERLAAMPDNEVVALRQNRHPVEVRGVALASYRFVHRPVEHQHPLMRDLEAKVLRAEAVADAARRLRRRGWSPDVIVAHPGWGEAMLLRTVWPDARLVSYLEYFYAPTGQDFGFDPEFAKVDDEALARLRLKNTAVLHAIVDSDAAWTATRWQRGLFPAWARDRIEVIHEGVDVGFFCPDPTSRFEVAGKGIALGATDEVVTFASRALEPVRGFHVFMRALPELLRRRPRAHVVIMGADRAAYGSDPEDAPTWLRKMMREVGSRLDPSRVHLVGFLDRVAYREVLRVSAAHVYLTYPFVLSWSMVEAMACGARLVASDTGPVREAMPPGSEPYVFDFFDASGLVDAVCRALDRAPEHRAREASALHEFAAVNYSTERQVGALTRLFAGAAPERTP